MCDRAHSAPPAAAGLTESPDLGGPTDAVHYSMLITLAFRIGNKGFKLVYGKEGLRIRKKKGFEFVKKGFELAIRTSKGYFLRI